MSGLSSRSHSFSRRMIKTCFFTEHTACLLWLTKNQHLALFRQLLEEYLSILYTVGTYCHYQLQGKR